MRQRGVTQQAGGLSVLLSLLLHAEIAEDRHDCGHPTAHRVSLADQRRAAAVATLSPTPSVSLVAFEDSVSVDASSHTHMGPTAGTQIKRLQNYMLEQEMTAPLGFSAHVRVVGNPALSPAQLASRRSVCYVHNDRDARASTVAVCERVSLAPPGRGPGRLAALVAGSWTLAAPIIIFDDRYGADDFWDFFTETVRCGANYFATASGISVDAQVLAVPVRETEPKDDGLTVDLLWSPNVEVTCESGDGRTATVLCARDAAQLDVIVEKARRAEKALNDRKRASHLVSSLLFFNRRTLRKVSLTVVRLVEENGATAEAHEQPATPQSSAKLLESLIATAMEDDLAHDAVKKQYLSTRLTAALYKKIDHLVRVKEYDNGALFHWICNVPCAMARRLPTHLSDQRLIEFRLCTDGDHHIAARQAARVAETIRIVQRAAQKNATEFTLLDPKRSSLTAERLSVFMASSQLQEPT